MEKNIRMGEEFQRVVGVDVGDRMSQVCWLEASTGEVLFEGRVRTTRQALEEHFGGAPRLRIALEVGTHSPWISRLLTGLEHSVWVADASRLPLIYQNRTKDDRVDAAALARLARVDPQLLHPVEHRSEAAQADLAVVRARQMLVINRTRLVQHCRGAVKSMGGRLPACDTSSFVTKARPAIPDELAPALEPLLEILDELTRKIRQMDRQIEQIARERYPDTQRLERVRGVGTLTALTFVLTLGEPHRFATSRGVGAYLGLVPGRDDSGDRRRPLRITKRGDTYLRTLLIQCAHYILGPFGEDCDLRRYGERLIARGGPGAKRQAAVAVARKLAVLLHRLWIDDTPYQRVYTPPMRQAA